MGLTKAQLAARKAVETRRKNSGKTKSTSDRSMAARKAWATRRRNEKVVGFYKDGKDRTRPITKSKAELKRKKLIKKPKKFKGVKPGKKRALSKEQKMIDTEKSVRWQIYSDATPYLKKGEKFDKVVAKDSATLKKLGISHKVLANRLTKFLKGPKDEEELWERGYKIGRGGHYKGYEHCPFGCSAKTSHDFVFINRKTKKKIVISGLMAHMIGKHKFFEGNVRYRVDPKTLVDLLGIKMKPKRKRKSKRRNAELKQGGASVYRLPAKRTWRRQSRSTPGKYYTVRLNQDDSLSCNCPGWIFSKYPKGCRHTREVHEKHGVG